MTRPPTSIPKLALGPSRRLIKPPPRRPPKPLPGQPGQERKSIFDGVEIKVEKWPKLK